MAGDKVSSDVSDVFQWVVGGLLGVLSSIGAFWLTNLTNRVEIISKEFYERGSRISTLEERAESVSHRLNRIEGKIDLLIEARHRQP